MYIPYLSQDNCASIIRTLCEDLEDPSRLLPGGYIYMGDILGDPMMVREIGRIFATAFSALKMDVVMTIETQGSPLAYAEANHLNVADVHLTRDQIEVEGLTVTIKQVLV